MITSYEDQLTLMRGLQQSISEDDRHISWCVGGGPVGVARNPKGLIEIFLEGSALEPRYRRVRQALEHQRWYRSGGQELIANRLLLPSEDHFGHVAAFLCTELLRNGATEDLVGAFGRTEPLIELAIADLLIADESLLGLCGEMLVLQALVAEARDEHVEDVIGSWFGHRETSRDFQLGWMGVEVKTTTRPASSHQFHGVHQLEIGHGVDDAEEEHFGLMSLGLEWTSSGDEANTRSLPETIDGILRRASEVGGGNAAIIKDLIRDVAQYGGAAVLGYDHRTMAESARFSRRFRLRFARLYDMADPAILLFTTDDLRVRPFIDRESLHLRVDLPDQVGGDTNPVSGLFRCARHIVGLAWSDQ